MASEQPSKDTDSLQSDHGTPNLSNGAGRIMAPKAAIYELDNFSQDTPQRELRRQRSAPSSVDDLDKTSVYSFFMEKDFRYYFQHPYLRLAVAYLVTFCNFLIYAEDPVAHSEAECFIPVVGNTFSFVVTKYPKNAWAALKVITWCIAILVGTLVGKMFIHRVVFNQWFKLKMFLDDQGSWMTMFFTTILSLFIFSHIYNLLLMIGGDSTLPYRITEEMGIKNSLFLRMAATGTWLGDFFTAWMVTDVMLQEKLYPHWAKLPRKWWNGNGGWNRIVLFWVMVLTMSNLVISVISTDVISWDRLNRDFMPTNEVSRSFLASFILVMDLLIVMQDWDFPHFVNNFDIKLPGLNIAHFKFRIPSCARRYSDAWYVHISGKWFNYGIIFMVMILDMNMWKNQMFYKPHMYGQYVNPDTRKIYTVRDPYSLQNFNGSQLFYEWRANTTDPLTNETYMAGDMLMNTLYMGYPLKYKGLAFVPSLFAFVCFVIFIYYFGRWKPQLDDPYAGRMKVVRRYPRLRNLRDSLVASFRRQSSAGKASPKSAGKSGGGGGEGRAEEGDEQYAANYKQIVAESRGGGGEQRCFDRSLSKVSYPENWNP